MFPNFIHSFREVLQALRSLKSFFHPPPLRRRLPPFACIHNSLPGQNFSPLLIRSSALSGYYGNEDILLFRWGPGGGGTQKSFIRGGSAPRSNPLPFYIPFFQKRHPFRIPFIGKRHPFHIPSYEKIVKTGSLLVIFFT